ncbi:sigma factor-like helix-turn-helix DNA-binding protein [Saccharopolyspora terrae]|uniref:sigma factor-like helix-turn-helix DNA-binding protein n=1 Tax=Saccharopolyspora terrae TaxID=2530384 RepID=UPI0038B4CB72
MTPPAPKSHTPARKASSQRKCLLLRFFHDFSIADTAVAMNRDVNAVKALQHRAIRRLAALFSRERTGPAEPVRERSEHVER